MKGHVTSEQCSVNCESAMRSNYIHMMLMNKWRMNPWL